MATDGLFTTLNMESYKYITVTGEVHWRGAPHKIPNKRYKSAYFTVKCPSLKQNPDKTMSTTYDYFTIHTYKESQIEKIREGYIIECLVKRDGRIWIKNGEMQMRDNYRTIDGQRVYYGTYPMVFESYDLLGDINVLQGDRDIEEIKENNAQFEDDLPF